MSDQVKLRTDVVLSCIIGKSPPVSEYLKTLDGAEITKQDMAALAMSAPESPYTMRDLEGALLPSEMVLPDYKDFLAGHTKVSTSYASDWPMASEGNRFGEHHPFGSNSNCCPLLHGSAWGEPHYVQHLFDFINGSGEKHQETERRNKRRGEDARMHGQPDNSVLSMYKKSIANSGLSEEEWAEQKRNHLTNDFGLLPYLFGLEWNEPEQIERFLDIVGKMSQTEDMDSPDAKKLMNDLQGKTGMTWDRALRNWRDRYTPLSAWWQRPSDRSGPTASGEDMFYSPYIEGEPGHNYHWWEPFQYWGGVGRDHESLKSLLSQSYPKIFGDGWLKSMLTDGVPIEGQHMLSGSHFPVSSNATPEHAHAHTPMSMGEGMDFERRRANWSHASRHQHLPPQSIEGQGNIMTIPSSAFNFSKLGQAIMATSDLHQPRSGRLREEHPNSNMEYYDLHNRHAKNTDQALATTMRRMATDIMGQFGAEHLAPDGTDPSLSTIARGNIQQIAQAAEYALLRGNKTHNFEYSIPDYSSGMKSMKRGVFGPVSPNSESVAAPSHNSGNTDGWGIPMPATLAWKWNRDTDSPEFSIKDTPFTTLQRTAHEGLVSAVDPQWSKKQIIPPNTTAGIYASNNSTMGFPTLSYDLAKSDDYKPTGVFKDTIEPAHVLRNLDDIDDLKGFTGNWIVQKKPKGRHLIVKKTGKSIEPSSLSSKIKKSMKDTIEGDVTFDAYADGDVLTVVDLLVHKGDDIHMEPLSDRVNILRTLYSTTENLHYPAPNCCVDTDQDGLAKAIANLDRDDLLVRDATSTFMKGKEVHPKWILYAQTDISKEAILPPLPEVSVKGSDIILEYPSIHQPVIVKTDTDEHGIFIESYEGPEYLIKNAKIQSRIWSPVAAYHIEPENPLLRHIPSYLKKTIDKAPEVITESEFDDDKSISDLMRHARKAITHDDKAKTTKEILALVDGLKESTLDKYAGEYGLEQMDDKRWTVNEAIDDDIQEKFAFPRMNRASADGGAWAGMQADITAPTGPTHITDEENTTFGNPREGEEAVDPKRMFKPLHMIVETEEGDSVLEVNEEKAKIRIPRKEKTHEEDENDVLPAIRDDKAL